MKSAGGDYQAAIENGWLSEMPWLVDKHKPHNYWTKERVFEEAVNTITKKILKKMQRQHS